MSLFSDIVQSWGCTAGGFCCICANKVRIVVDYNYFSDEKEEGKQRKAGDSVLQNELYRETLRTVRVHGLCVFFKGKVFLLATMMKLKYIHFQNEDVVGCKGGYVSFMLKTIQDLLPCNGQNM